MKLFLFLAVVVWACIGILAAKSVSEGLEGASHKRVAALAEAVKS